MTTLLFGSILNDALVPVWEVLLYSTEQGCLASCGLKLRKSETTELVGAIPFLQSALQNKLCSHQLLSLQFCMFLSGRFGKKSWSVVHSGAAFPVPSMVPLVDL